MNLSRCTFGGICVAGDYLAEEPNWSWRRRSASICAASRAPWRLAAVSPSAFDISATSSLFRPQDDRRRYRAPHMAGRARPSASAAAPSRPMFHPHPAVPVWRNSVEQHSHRAGELILLRAGSRASVQDELLARTVIVAAGAVRRQPLARNPRGVHIPELFVSGVPAVSPAPAPERGLVGFFCRARQDFKLVPWPKATPRRLKMRSWTTERLNGEDGLGRSIPHGQQRDDVRRWLPPELRVARLRGGR